MKRIQAAAAITAAAINGYISFLIMSHILAQSRAKVISKEAVHSKQDSVSRKKSDFISKAADPPGYAAFMVF